MTRLIVDCDPGVDDALALMLAAASPELDLVAVTTVAGNRPVAITSVNARRILDLSGKHSVPVYAGATRPFGHAQARCNTVHGEDGLGGVEIGASTRIGDGHAAIRLIELLTQSPPSTVELVAIGPLTNLALAELLAPGILARARRLSIMGGALRVSGNVTPAAEFNFYADPVAAEMVLTSMADIVLFPLDVTGKAIMSPVWIASLAAHGASGRAAAAMLDAYAQLDPLLHDACPIAYLINPRLFSGEDCSVSIEWGPGATEGHSTAHFRTQNDRTRAARIRAITDLRLQPLLELVGERIARLP